MADVPAGQVLAHRIVWSCVALGALLAWPGRRRLPRGTVTPRVVALYLAAAAAHRRQLVSLRVGGRARLRRRDQPRLLHHAARERAARRGHPPRASARARRGPPSALAAAGVAVSHVGVRRAAAHRARAGGQLRHLRPGEEDRAAAAARRARARDGAARAAGAGLSRGGRARGLRRVPARPRGHRRVPDRRRAGDDRAAAAVCVGGSHACRSRRWGCCSSSRRRFSSCWRWRSITSRSGGRVWPASWRCGWRWCCLPSSSCARPAGASTANRR